MLIAYLVCLLAGCILISLSLDNEGGFDGEGGYLSLLFSTPFWSFGLTGFGLCGVLMLLLSPEGSWLPPSLVALAMGLLMGWAAGFDRQGNVPFPANEVVAAHQAVGVLTPEHAQDP